MNIKIWVHIGLLYFSNRTFVGDNNIKSNIFRIQAYDSIMCGCFCIEFINYMFDGKSLIDFTSLFSPHDFKKNDQIIKRIFKNE